MNQEYTKLNKLRNIQMFENKRVFNVLGDIKVTLHNAKRI